MAKPVEQIPSSFAVAAQVRMASADEVAQLEVDVVYRLEGCKSRLAAGYRNLQLSSGYEKKDAVIIGSPKEHSSWCTLKKACIRWNGLDSQLIAPKETAEEVSGDGDLVPFIHRVIRICACDWK